MNLIAPALLLSMAPLVAALPGVGSSLAVGTVKVAASVEGERDVLPGPGESITNRGIKVTLLGAKRLSHEEYRQASGTLYKGWAGDGLHLAFLVENRPGAPLLPALGEVRVLFDSAQYNPVTHSSSRKPLSPYIIIEEPEAFFATPFGRVVRERVKGTVESQPPTGILEVFIRGGAIPAAADGIVEIEQGETYRPDAEGRLRPLSPAEMGQTWTWFRFRLPRLD
jgi:hypothetical protein